MNKFVYNMHRTTQRQAPTRWEWVNYNGAGQWSPVPTTYKPNQLATCQQCFTNRPTHQLDNSSVCVDCQ